MDCSVNGFCAVLEGIAYLCTYFISYYFVRYEGIIQIELLLHTGTSNPEFCHLHQALYN